VRFALFEFGPQPNEGWCELKTSRARRSDPSRNQRYRHDNRHRSLYTPHRYAIIFDSIKEVNVGRVRIRNLDDRVIESLKTKAELKGRSLEQELRDVLTNAAPLTPEEKIAVFKKVRAMMPAISDVDVQAAIRRGRDDAFDE
jgi:antitoxin FitA